MSCQLKGQLSPFSSVQGNISSTLQLKGELTNLQSICFTLTKADGEISSVLSSIETLKGELSKPIEITSSISPIISQRIETYNGEYNITPLAFEDIILNTKDKKLTDNIIVKEIPYYQTSNKENGYTVIIG